jgi:CHASE3 domain sensor protein
MLKNLRLKYRILLGYTVPLLLSVIVAVVVYSCVKTVEQQEAKMDNTAYAKAAVLDLQVDMVKTENSARGYMLGKSDNKLKAFQEAMKRGKEHFEPLRKLLQYEPQQLERVKGMEGLTERIFQWVTKEIDLADSGKVEEAVAMHLSGTGDKMVGGV